MWYKIVKNFEMELERIIAQVVIWESAKTVLRKNSNEFLVYLMEI